MVTDRTLPHAGPTGEIWELPLSLPANSIRNASGSRLCLKLIYSIYRIVFLQMVTLRNVGFLVALQIK